ncbi:type 1 glutamine amidotransferase domain-containing protein [Parvicella tangerina]|uniref:Protein/nucleic acid deglycase 1 n=1 Tax=Parvicella tangerina TaxID=2829795 RepID=A0A916JR01_9FLAO|nr:type 1 glutamine amidotransferase domain-containing protein [Parvicella tangerina]CAG5087771.1 Protein/nucleic acid deglycase 1 [Parvicella tangerina]
MEKKKILAVATNSNNALNKEKTTGLWLSELTHFIDVVMKAGYEVDIASPSGGKIPLDVARHSFDKQMKDKSNAKFMNIPRLKQSLENSLSINEISVADYEAIYLTGGHGAMFDFRQSEALQKKLTEFHSSNKVLSGVCHGVAGFIDTRDKEGSLIVRNKNITGFSNFEDKLAEAIEYLPFLLETELKNIGAIYQKNLIPFTSRVEIDGKLITGQNPASAKAVGKAVVRLLKD